MATIDPTGTGIPENQESQTPEPVQEPIAEPTPIEDTEAEETEAEESETE